MKRNRAKLFICHHPVVLTLYKNLAEIIRKNDKDAKIILFKVNHSYFNEFDFEPYRKYYDKVIDFDFIGYKMNFMPVMKFKKDLNSAVSFLRDFDEIDLFLSESAWLPINIMLYNLSKEKNIKNISRLSFAEPVNPQAKVNKLKSFLCSIYSGAYKVKVVTSPKGKFLNFEYNDNIPGKIVTIVSPASEMIGENNILPYPVMLKPKKRNMVIVFGDTSIFPFYKEYLPDEGEYNEKISAFFKALEKKYAGCDLYYKPHPADGNKIMPGIDTNKYKLFDNSIDAQVLFDRYNIKACYAFSSFSVIFGSFFATPSYFFYPYIFNEKGIERLNSFYDQDILKSKFIYRISNLKDIGKIDNVKKPKGYGNFDKIYCKIMNI